MDIHITHVERNKREREREKSERRRGWAGPIRLIPRRRPRPKERNKKEWESHRLRVIPARLPTPILGRHLRGRAVRVYPFRGAPYHDRSLVFLRHPRWNSSIVLSLRSANPRTPLFSSVETLTMHKNRTIRIISETTYKNWSRLYYQLDIWNRLFYFFHFIYLCYSHLLEILSNIRNWYCKYYVTVIFFAWIFRIWVKAFSKVAETRTICIIFF